MLTRCLRITTKGLPPAVHAPIVQPASVLSARCPTFSRRLCQATSGSGPEGPRRGLLEWLTKEWRLNKKAWDTDRMTGIALLKGTVRQADSGINALIQAAYVGDEERLKTVAQELAASQDLRREGAANMKKLVDEGQALDDEMKRLNLMLMVQCLLMFYFCVDTLAEKLTKKTTEIFVPIYMRKRMEDEMEEAVPALSEAEKEIKRQFLSVVLEEALSGRAKTDPGASMAIFLRKRMEDEMEEAVPALSEAEKEMKRQALSQFLSVALEEALSGRAKTDPGASMAIFLRKRMEDEMEEAVPALSEAEKEMKRQALSVVLEEALSGRAKTDPDASKAIVEGQIEGHRWLRRHVEDLDRLLDSVNRHLEEATNHLQRPQRYLEDLFKVTRQN